MTEPRGFVARYAASAARKFAVRGWIVAILLALILVGIIVPVVVTTGNIVPGIIGGLFAVIAVSWAVVSAVRAPARWSADDRLAIAVSDEGVTLPSIGLTPWDRIVGFQVFDMGGLTGNVWVSAIQFLNGTRNSQEIVLYVRGNQNSLARKLDRAGRQALRSGTARGTVGLAGAWGQGLTSPSFSEVAAVVEDAAAQRGLPVAH